MIQLVYNQVVFTEAVWSMCWEKKQMWDEERNKK